MYEIYPRWWKFGRPADFWLTNLEAIKGAIEQYKLTPVPREHLMQMGGVEQVRAMADERAQATLVFPRPDFPGGLKIPHFHFKGDVYLLDEKQWRDFSAKVIKDFQTRLDRVNTVSFEQVMELSEVVHGLV